MRLQAKTRPRAIKMKETAGTENIMSITYFSEYFTSSLLAFRTIVAQPVEMHSMATKSYCQMNLSLTTVTERISANMMPRVALQAMRVRSSHGRQPI